MGKKPRNAQATIVSRNLQKVLEERDMSARAGAALADVPQSTFTSWVNGSSLPMDFLALQRFAKGAKVNFEWLCTGKVETPKANNVEELFEVDNGEPALSGLYLLEARRVRPKGSGGSK
jgi:hypothetical protein